ncbi:MAG: LysR family transcriptional regulator [Oscillospiraceae bacterium]|nr:LysR family transcriptional regulator [Oscillospiraceae bacterium]
MKLAQLRYFVAVVDSGSLSAAAKQLNISQPTISVTIKELEDELGVMLFNREKNRLVPTGAGTYFYSKVISVLQQLDSAVMGTKKMSADSKIVTVGIPPMIGSFFTPMLLSAVNKKIYSFDLNIVEYDSGTLKNMLNNNLIDFAVLLSSYADTLEAKMLFVEEYKMFCSPQNILRSMSEVAFDDIKDEPFIVFDRILVKGNSGLATRFRENGANPVIPIMTKQISAIKNYVRENVASTVLMNHCVGERDGLVRVNLADNLKTISSICLCHNKGKALSENEKETAKFIAEVAKKLDTN